MKPKIIVVCGPTASGKSDKAVELALQINGEVISADSRQVYKGLDIGSGKITKEEMKGIKHYLLDIEDPQNIFSVKNFACLGEEAIQTILSKGKTPIICGGTGFYIDTLIYSSQFPTVPPNTSLREELELVSVEKLQTKLQELDMDRYCTIDIWNPVRLIRAIEIATELGKVPVVQKELKYDIEFIYLDFPKEELTQRIFNRLYKRLDQGMLEEAQMLNTRGLSFERMKQLGLEYRYMAMYLLKEISHQEMCELIILKSTQYAKRQRLWFRKYIK